MTKVVVAPFYNTQDINCVNSDCYVRAVGEHNVSKIESPEASHLTPLERRLLLHTVLTKLHNIFVTFMNVLWQTHA